MWAAICPCHQRDSDGVLAVGEDRRGQLVFPVYFFCRRDCVDFALAQRDTFNRLDLPSFDCTGCDRVGESMVERGQQRVEDFVPSRISARCRDDIVGAGSAQAKGDRVSLGGERRGAELGESGDPIAQC